MVKAPVFFPSAIKLRNVSNCQAKIFEVVDGSEHVAGSSTEYS